MDEKSTLWGRVNEHDLILRGDGHLTPGLTTRVLALEADRKEVRNVIREWADLKAQLRGARTAFIIASIILGLLGGGFGIAILEALQRIAREMP